MNKISKNYLQSFVAFSVILAGTLYLSIPLLPALFISVNILAFCFMGLDKKAARRGLERIPEFVLLLAAFAGAGPGVLVGATIFRHKIRKTSFMLPVITLTVFYLGILWYLRSLQSQFLLP